MNTRLVKWATLTAMAMMLGSPVYTSSHESFEVASLLLRLSRSIANDLSRPVPGAERIVTKALVSEEGTNRIYYIEGKDISHTGRVLSSYWLRLIKPLYDSEDMHAAVNTSDSYDDVRGRLLYEDTQRVIEFLLNGLYDIAAYPLDHRNVILEDILPVSLNPSILEIVAINNVCEHEDQNRFKLTISRHVERNRTWYETRLEHPYIWFEDPIPVIEPIYPDPLPYPLPSPPSLPSYPEDPR